MRSLGDDIQQIKGEGVSAIPVETSEQPSALWRKQVTRVELEVRWKHSFEEGQYPCFDSRLRLMPFFITHDQASHDEDRLQCIVQVCTRVSGLVDVEEVQCPSPYFDAHRCDFPGQSLQGGVGKRPNTADTVESPTASWVWGRGLAETWTQGA